MVLWVQVYVVGYLERYMGRRQRIPSRDVEALYSSNKIVEAVNEVGLRGCRVK